MGFPSLRRRQLEESTHPGLPRPVRSACRFSQPRSGLLLLEPRGFVSPRRHPWDSVLQSVLLDTCRGTSSVPDALWSLPSYRSRVPRNQMNGGARSVRRPWFGRRDLAADFRALLTWRARSVPLGCYPSRLPMLSWTLSSLGSPVPRRWPGFRQASSRASTDACPREGLRACLHSGVLLVRSRGFLSLESAFPF